MANVTRNFIKGKMNKMLDERIVPNGEYIDALNIRMGSSEGSEIGTVENSKGNEKLSTLEFNGNPLSGAARCIGAFEDGAEETVYWFVHDPQFEYPGAPLQIVDMVVSLDTKTNILTYHLISVMQQVGLGLETTLNFSFDYLITGVSKVEDLLYFTDDYNQPRQINVRKNYGNPVNNLDGFSAESILVIKKPPSNAPSIKPLITSSQDNFLEDRFICFAYRYRYEDKEYSATSQFSNPSFIPNTFRYNAITSLNSGMLNSTNMCDVTYDSGGPLVKSIDLLFKDMNSSTIKIIEKLDKEDLGLADNTTYTYRFNNSKIFTILPDSEILRLFDNVPLKAQAQTLMGNRLVYGNYVEGNVLSRNNVPTKLEYTLSLESQDIGLVDLESTQTDGNYSIDTNQIIPESVLNIDLTDLDLVAGSAISFLFRFEHDSFSGQTPFPSQQTQETNIDFTYILPVNFSSVYALATSVDFSEKIGVTTNIESVPTSCNGTTFTDAFYCSVQNSLDSLLKRDGGISAVGQPIEIITSPGSDILSLQIPAVEFFDAVTPTQTVYEYYKITQADSSFQEIGDPSSLHSNRGYEVGMVYMDDYNRSSTTLVSPNNTIHVPCALSDTKNEIIVTIPDTQIAPEWATRYKFCIKPDKEAYDVIYSNFFFRDPTSGADYFLLEGQNSQKIQEGDELIVKSDTSGSVDRCTWTTVLEKKGQQRDFLEPPPIDSSGVVIESVPAGTYMKIRANNFNTDVGDNPVIDYGEKKSNGRNCRVIDYPVDYEDPDNPGTYIDYIVPAGSRITIDIRSKRGPRRNVPKKVWDVDATFVASQEYQSFQEWFNGDNIAGSLEQQADTEGTGVNGPNYQSGDGSDVRNRPCNVGDVYMQFYNDGTRTYLGVKSTKGYRGKRKNAYLDVHIEVIRANGLIVFESDPQDSAPDLWYESSTSYPISAIGEHEGNIQNQSVSNGIPAIINTEFFNCYAFGNGVESYKIEDAITGKPLVLGNRALTTDSKLFDLERRSSDLTYSGVYNSESNINKLNEFNGGLLNFKALEQSFGPAMKIVGRRTDILVLQEDRISYVLAGKNLLSDAAGGSSLTSVPEVLGTQIARSEEFGISHNPESFAMYGADKYFTDAKRGAVLRLVGTAGQNEQLEVISQQGMRPWFRDLFNNSFNTQKLGGYDPYMNEFVLSSNTKELPTEVICLDCGVTQSLTINDSTKGGYDVCFNLGVLVGNVDIDYGINNGTATITAEYNSNTYTTGQTTGDGTLTFNKDIVNEEEVSLNISGPIGTDITFTVNCPDADDKTIYLVHIGGTADAGLQITDKYRWTDGTFISPLHSETVVFNSGQGAIVSLYAQIFGQQGGGVIPANSAVVKIMSDKNVNNGDDYNFDIASDKFKYLRTNTLYGSNPQGIADLLSVANTANPIDVPVNGNTSYFAEFNMPSVGNKLYLIWDYRTSTPMELCFGDSPTSACCDCGDLPDLKYKLIDCDTGYIWTVEDTFGSLTTGNTVQYRTGVGQNQGTTIFCGELFEITNDTPNATIQSSDTVDCGDYEKCDISDSGCSLYTLFTTSGTGQSYSYIDCDGNAAGGSIGGASGVDQETICAQTGTVDPGLNSISQGQPCS
jgi:hypothetical protein